MLLLRAGTLSENDRRRYPPKKEMSRFYSIETALSYSKIRIGKTMGIAAQTDQCFTVFLDRPLICETTQS